MSTRAASALEVAVAIACAYEVVAITTRRRLCPTISTVCRSRGWLSVIILAGLAAHLAGWPPPSGKTRTEVNVSNGGVVSAGC